MSVKVMEGEAARRTRCCRCFSSSHLVVEVLLVEVVEVVLVLELVPVRVCHKAKFRVNFYRNVRVLCRIALRGTQN